MCSKSNSAACDSPVGDFVLDAVPEPVGTPIPPIQVPYDVAAVIRAQGYHSVSSLATTLQGAVFKAKLPKQDDREAIDVVIKVTSKALHARHIAIVNGKEVLIEESIVDEIRIMRWLTRHSEGSACAGSMAHFIEYFEDERNIFLVMEDAGMDFLKFVAECHKLIEQGQLSLKEWQSAVRTLFTQMVEFVDWLHSTMGICHLDISLENLLTSDVFVMSDTAP